MGGGSTCRDPTELSLGSDRLRDQSSIVLESTLWNPCWALPHPRRESSEDGKGSPTGTTSLTGSLWVELPVRRVRIAV